MIVQVIFGDNKTHGLLRRWIFRDFLDQDERKEMNKQSKENDGEYLL